MIDRAQPAPPPHLHPAPPRLVLPAALPGPAGPSRLHRRHRGVIASFVLLVALPAVAAAWYLWMRAADQYASYVGFSVRREEAGPALEMLGGFAALSGSSSSDTDILYQYMASPRLVADIDAALGLRAIWSRAKHDPVFAFHAPGTIEDLVDHWNRMVRVSYDSATRLIEVRVLAFDPDDATAIAEAILIRSGTMINELSDIAREDTIRYARTDLAEARARLAMARSAITTFRNRTQTVDPAADVQGQTGLLARLQDQLAAALIEVDLLAPTMQASDHRLARARARVAVIEARIAAERRKLGLGEGPGEGAAYAALVGEYERLAADLAFAEEAYRTARAGYDAARAEARRQGRYLAAHTAPTRAESARFPQRATLLATVTLFLLLIWATGALIYFALRDRR